MICRGTTMVRKHKNGTIVGPSNRAQATFGIQISDTLGFSPKYLPKGGFR
ncbi:MAG: hypothetical protein V7606_3125 [Burkholderiales bacterium]